MFDLEGYLERGQQVSATPTGPTFRAALEPAHVAMVTILATLDPGATVAGDVPELPAELLTVPPGAVAAPVR